MTDDLINLLPDELRQPDQTELNASIQKSAPVSYSQVDKPKEPEINNQKIHQFDENFSLADDSVNSQDQEKPKFSNQASDQAHSVKSMPLSPKNNSPIVDRPASNGKTKEAVTIGEPQRAHKSWSAFWLKLFSIKPKSSTLDNASVRTNGNLSFDVNLVPQSAYNLPGKILGLRLVLAAMMVIFFISLVHWSFVFFNQSAIQKVVALQTILDRNQAALRNYKDLTQQLNQLEVQSRGIDGLISRHIYWTQFLTKLENLTLPNVYYSSMTANPSGIVNLQVVAPTYTDAVEQVLFWQNRPEIKKVEFSGLSGNPASGEINLSVKLELDPTVFYKN